MRKRPIFSSNIHIFEEDKKKLLNIFKNHLVIYNHFLELGILNNNLKNSEKRRIIKEFIEKNNIDSYIINAILNEIYYQEKKLRNSIYKQKNITDIQYITITDNSLSIDFETRKCVFDRVGISFYLVNELDEELYLRRKYINISYSINKDKFEFKIF